MTTQMAPVVRAYVQRLAILLASWLSCCAAAGQPLILGKTNPLQVRSGGDVFIAEDALSLAQFAEAQLESFTDVGGWQSITVLRGGSKKDCIYYREIGTKPGRIEITWYIKFAPYQFGTDFPGHSYNYGGARYEMRIPVEFLDGARYKAVTGSLFRPTIKEGELTAGNEDGKVIEIKIWYITFTRNGQPITLDLNPVGPHNFGFKTMLCERDWRLSREGDCFVLWANMTKVKWGETRSFKIAITPRDWAYETSHTSSLRGVKTYLKPDKSINFSPKTTKRYEQADCSSYDRGRGHGWHNGLGLKLVRTGLPDEIKRDYVRGAGEYTYVYVIDVADGIYLVNLVLGSTEEASGPLDVLDGDIPKLTGLRTAKGDFAVKTFHTRARNRQIRVGIRGKSWTLNGLSVTPLMYDSEDYLLKRTWWIQQRRFDDWFAKVEPIPSMPPIIRKAEAGDPMAWTWNCSFEGLEGSNDSTRTALDTPESIEQRLRVIRSAGFKGVIINGLHFRFGHLDPKRMKITLRNTRLAVETAHRMGLKVIDHWDFNWVFYTGYPAMLNALDADPDCLQRHLGAPLGVSTAFCLNSPVFVDELKRLLVEVQKATDVDGYMLDEISWFSAPYCACDRCRRVFHQETGLRLPHDTRGFQDNFENPRWRAFVTWRGRKEKQVFESIIAEARKIRPDAVFLRYRSGEFSRPHRTGLELNQGMPWGAHYVGDEFHPDAILMNWRMMFGRLKNAQGIVSSYGNHPTWILAKGMVHDTRVLYGWAIARMNRSNVWYRAGDRAFSNKLNSWTWQMKDQHARPLSEVAVLLSQRTRDFRSSPSYYHGEYAAWIQTMAEESIQYSVILDRDVTPDRLARYKVLLLPNVALLSERQAQTIGAFVASGGSVIAIYETGLFDEGGERREDSVFAGAMGLRKLGYVPWRTRVRFGAELAKGMAAPHVDTTARHCVYRARDASRSRVLAKLLDPVKGKEVAPAVIETRFGKGKFYYVSGNLLSQNYEPRMATPSSGMYWMAAPTYPVRMNRGLNRLARNLLTMAIGKDYRTAAVSVPEKVIYAAFEQNHDGKSAILVHFLNCRGKPDLKFGDPLKLLDPIPQPPLPADVVVRVKSPAQIREAFVVAPLREGKTPVAMERVGDDAYSVIVPKTAIENYAVLYLEKAEYRPSWHAPLVRITDDVPQLPKRTVATADDGPEMGGEPYEPDEHTLLLMHFDETEGHVAHDAANPSLKAVLSEAGAEEALWSRGRFENALTFTPDGRQMIVPDRKERRFAFTEKQDFTIDFWLHTNPPSPRPRQSILFTGGSSSRSRGIGIYVFNSKLIAQLCDGEGRKDSRLYLYGDGSVLGEWHHVALIVDRSGALGTPGRAYLFVDGTQQKKPRDISKHSSFQSAGDLRLGSYTGAADYGLNGKIDELRISSKVRPARELGYGGYFPQR